MRISFGIRKHVAILMAFVMLAVGLIPANAVKAFAGEIITFATNETFTSSSGGTSPFNVDTRWLHWRSDGEVAYCRQKGLNNPDGTTGSYAINNWEPGEHDKMAGLFANADSVAGSYGISGDSKRALIQMVIWAVQHDYDSFNPAPGSVTSSDPTMMSAFWSLYNASYGGYTAQAASINGLTNGTDLTGGAFSASYVRYGPFSVDGSTDASASVANAPAGSYFGDGSGSAVNKDSLANGQTFYLYIPFSAGSTTVPSITIRAAYSIVSVTKYSGFWGYQDQIVGGDPGSAEISATANLLGFGKAELWKQDDEDSPAALSGAVFEIDRWSISQNGWQLSGVSISWNASSRRYETGALIETADNEGRFRIRETQAPYSYLTSWSEEVNVRTQYGTTFRISASNQPVKLRINLSKHDRNTNTAIPQGDAALEGALYGLYMNETREHPNGKVYTKDQKIAEAYTDEKGEVTFEDLFPAKYYIKELSPSEGYLLDDTVYEIDGTHDGASKSVVRNVAVTEQVKKQKFELIKVGTSEEETEVTLLGAGFKVYLISELTGVKDGSLSSAGEEWSYRDFKGYDFTDEKTAMIDGKTTPEFFTDSLGHLITPEFPYGTYVVIESTTSDGYMAINPFIVRITEDSRDAQPWRIFDDKEMKYYIRVIKKDADTGNIVLNKTAKYRIFDLEKGEYIKMKTTYPSVVWHGTEDNPFATDETGRLITPEKLPYGQYRLDEVVAPDGYVLAGHEVSDTGGYNPKGETVPNPSDPVYVEFGESTPVYVPEAEDDVLEVVQYNEQQRGKVNVEKKGALPASVKEDKDGNLIFAYTDEPLEGVIFHVIADGDIISQDGSGTVVFAGGEVVCEISTDEEGHAWSGDLPIGSYILREISAPEGYLFVPDEYFSITQIEQEKQYTFLTWDLTDVRQMLNIEIVKKDKETGTVLSGAEFSLYAAEDIHFGTPERPAESIASKIVSFFTGRYPFYLIEKDMLIGKAVSGEDGKALFSDLPPGKYYVIETKAPDGYILNADFRAEFALSYDGHEMKSITLKGECLNEAAEYPVPETPAPAATNPKMGDSQNLTLWIIIALAALGAASAIITFRRRSKKAEATEE